MKKNIFNYLFILVLITLLSCNKSNDTPSTSGDIEITITRYTWGNSYYILLNTEAAYNTNNFFPILSDIYISSNKKVSFKKLLQGNYVIMFNNRDFRKVQVINGETTYIVE